MFSGTASNAVSFTVYVVGAEGAARAFLTALVEMLHEPEALFETPFGCLTSTPIAIADEEVTIECFAFDEDAHDPNEPAIAQCDALLILPGPEARKEAIAAVAHAEHPPLIIWYGAPTQPVEPAFADLLQVERSGTAYDVFKGVCVGLMTARKAGQLRERNPSA